MAIQVGQDYQRKFIIYQKRIFLRLWAKTTRQDCKQTLLRKVIFLFQLVSDDSAE